MRVQLAYPYDGHKPDDVVEVSDAVGQRMINEGRARPAPSKTSKTDTSKTSETSESTSKSTSKEK